MSQSDYIDASTGIHNRNFLEEQSTEIILYQKFKKQSFSLILADIDCCKIQNDLYGYKAVDFRIQKIAHIIANCVHVSKIDHVLVRWAGDQFLLVLLNYSYWLPNCVVIGHLLIKSIKGLRKK